MTTVEQESILTLALMAAFADGAKHDTERAELKRIAESLPHAEVKPAALYQRVLLKQVTPAQAAAALPSPELRQLAYEMAGMKNPAEDLDFIELHDAYTSSEIQTYEDLGLCRYGEGGPWAEEGHPFLANLDYGLKLKKPGTLPVNPSGGLIACGHPVGATGLMQAVFALWQLQETVGKHFGSDALQVPGARRGLIHSHAGTGTYVTVTILEKG